jgi:predicted DCC family thiol-disulfide oxidoreductase YuxK
MSERLFYDGDCGMCHRAVTFVLARDRRGAFRFAPLDSETFRAAVPEATRAHLPDSMVVLTSAGALLTRSDAIVHILETLGGFWAAVGRIIAVLPRAVRDWGYDRVAAVRKRLFAPPAGVCPVVPAAVRGRFDA